MTVAMSGQLLLNELRGDGNTVEEVAALPSLASDTPPTPKAAEKPAVEAPPSSGASFTFRLPDNTSKEAR